MQDAAKGVTLSPFLMRLERVALISTRALSVVGLGSLMIFAFVTLINGLLRWLINQPIAGVADVGALTIAIAVSCCIPISMIERSHITLRFFSSAAPRLGSVLDIIVDTLVVVILALMAWQFWKYSGEVLSTGESTFVLRVPVAPFWYACAAILWIAAAVQCVVVALDVGMAIEKQKASATNYMAQEH